jgi:hypothetical protein
MLLTCASFAWSVYKPYGLIRKREVAVKVMDCCWRASNSWEIIELVISPRRQGGSLSWDSWYSLGSRIIEGRILGCCGREHWKNYWLNLQKFSVFWSLWSTTRMCIWRLSIWSSLCDLILVTKPRAIFIRNLV